MAHIGQTPTVKAIHNTMQTLSWSVNEAKSIDFTAGHVVWINLSETATSLTITGATAGDRITMFIKQDTVGSKLISAWTNFKWAGGSAPTLSTAISAIDCVTGFFDGTNWYADKALAFA
jgi:hypothetical protein